MSDRTKEVINYSIMYIGIIAFLTSIIYNICTSGLGLQQLSGIYQQQYIEQMKRIKLTVASILLGGMCYAQCTVETRTELEKERQAIEYRLLDMIDAIRMDMYYGKVFEDAGMYYINEINEIRAQNHRLANTIDTTYVETDVYYTEYNTN